MLKNVHEFRDPVHGFIHLDSDERKALDSRPLQRLRHIHQLATTYLVYPGASHKRFEHSLGVMELAGRVFDVVTAKERLRDDVRAFLPQITNDDALSYWRRVLRCAALFHDAGHLPFSHAAEEELLPSGWTHERMSREIIQSREMKNIWNAMSPPPRPVDIEKIAVGRAKAKDLEFSTWDRILSEIIVGDALGVDRMDYLLRDSYHTGVAYGRFDIQRLTETMRLLPSVYNKEPELGLEEGGLRAAEGLLIARFFMYSQVYFHSVRRIYDIHLKSFLRKWLPKGKFKTTVRAHLRVTDNEVTAGLLRAMANSKRPGHEDAKRICGRGHFKVLYQRDAKDMSLNPQAALTVYKNARRKFGASDVEFDSGKQKGGALDFPVLTANGDVQSSAKMSEMLNEVPVAAFDYVYITPERREEAERWLKANRNRMIKKREVRK